ncbi:hypothetical protein PG996_015067 [Apiospora saccharicola]|uniref:Uncharacterized protein n=1 Tax=Apiospora saccharicola TaxID=335842 RepID=A0ABR1TK41_9PEZI
MKSIFVAGLLMATSVFSAAVPVAVVGSAVPEKRQLESQGSILDNLLQQIVVQTTQINATRDAAGENPSVLEIPGIADKINTNFAAMTEALKQAATKSDSARKSTRAIVVARQDNSTSPADGDAEDGDKCDAACITEKVLAIVQEVASTIRSVIEKFGLAPFLLRINPLLLALSALVIGLDVLVSGLLLTVTAVVNVILGGLGLSLLALGFAAV